MSSPGYSYLLRSSRTSSSTRSNSSASSTRSHLFRNTTIAGTFTCRASKMCSRVCGIGPRSEEHTSELQSLAYLVCRLLLEKKKNVSSQKSNTIRHELLHTGAIHTTDSAP